MGKSQVRPLLGADLDEVCRIAEKRSSIHAVSVSALPHVTIPDVGHPNFLRFRRVPMNLASVIMENPVWISVLWPGAKEIAGGNDERDS